MAFTFMRIVVALALLLPAASTTAREESDETCFVDPVWAPEEIVNTSGCSSASIASGARCAWSLPPNRTDIQYGSAYNPTYKRQEALLLDLFLPPPSDTRKKRPGFVLMHGGGFVGGSKSRHGSGPGVEAYMGAAFAQRGFVAVSISYRLAKPDTKTYGKYGVSQTNDSYVIDGVHDLKAAIRFMRKNAEAWGVDPTRFGACGESAGEFTWYKP
jgi:acetyl esterase/lipase